MKKVSWLLTTVFCLVLIGCGGGVSDLPVGPGVGSNSTTPTIEAVNRQDATIYVDPENIEIDDEVIFQLVAYDLTTGARSVLAATNWSSSDTKAVYGNLASNSGLYLAGSHEINDRLVVASTFDGNNYSAFYRVKPRQVLLHGFVYAQGTTTPVRGVAIEFYNESQVLVGTVHSMADGSFRASIPSSVASAISYNLVPETIPATYYHNFLADGLRYQSGTAGCRVTLPSYDNGPRELPYSIFVTPKSAGVAEPDPDGCTPGP